MPSADRMGYLCEDCFLWVPSLELAQEHCMEWQHSLAVCPERNAGLRMWTVYDHPLDLPEAWVVRPSRVVRPELSADGSGVIPAPRCWQFDSLVECHDFLAQFHLTRVQGRDPHDEKIAEVWV